MEPSREPFRNTHNRNIPFSFPTSSRATLNLNSRPFVLDNRPQNNFNHFNTNSLPPLDTPVFQTIELQRLNFFERAPAPVKPKVKCNYCSQDFASEIIAEHTEHCDLRKIACDQCGQRILMEIFDIHIEECDGRGPIEYIYQQALLRAHSADDISGEVDEENESMENDENEITEATFQQEGGLNYEALLRLDETVVKKGMTPEQMKEFQVQLYVKSLDGEGSCNICLYEYETGEYVRKLPCCHKFHRDCIDKWLNTNITCPMCKKYLR